MALDTTYRPKRFEDVIGQENTVAVLRQFVKSGAGFHQSYLFCGGHGSGKCVVGDTLVPTDRGIMPIRDLMGPNQIDPSNILVQQERGVQARAAYSYRGGLRETLRVRTRMGYEIEGTPNHRIRVRGLDGQATWRSLDALRIGDVACLVLGGLFGSEANLAGVNPQKDDSSILTSEMSQLLGLYIENTDLMVLASWLNPCPIEEREVPWSVMASPAPIVVAFLHGLLEGHAEVGPKGIRLPLHSRKLATQVHILFLMFGVPACLDVSTCCLTIEADLSAHLIVSESRSSFFVLQALREFIDTMLSSVGQKSYFDDAIVEITPGLAEVFDLNVPDGEMFAANGFMNHNTTLGRILARALLCEHPVDGDPCDACASCRSILDRGSSDCFVEVDAATNSSKDDVKEITDLLQYDTFSGRRRIYLFDEAHRLSRDALDALLKPMEDTTRSGDEKLLICIFCTTEPEKMRATIRSRCAPAFVIRRVSVDGIADRLAVICEKEGIPFERPALVMIAEVTECHIRDALKSVEGVAQLGAVDVPNVRNYLRLNANATLMGIIACLGRDLSRALALANELQEVMSPGIIYEQLSDLAMLTYRVSLGVGKPPSYWNEQGIRKLSDLHGQFLVRIAQVLASKPGRPTFAMLDCDLAALHFERRGEFAGIGGPPVPIAPVSLSVPALPIAEGTSTKVNVSSEIQERDTGDVGRVVAVDVSVPTTPPPVGPRTTRGGVYVEPRAVKKREPGEKNTTSDGSLPPLPASEFRVGLRRLVEEMALDGRSNRSSG